MSADIADQKGITVRLGLLHSAGCDLTTAARAVFHHNRITDVIGDLGGNLTPEQLLESLDGTHAHRLEELVSMLCQGVHWQRVIEHDVYGLDALDDALGCAECGTAFPSVEAAGTGGTGAPSEPAPPAAKGPTLGAKAATMILLTYVAAQFTVGGLVGMIAGIASEIQHRAPGQPTDSAKLKEEIISATVIPAMVGGGLVMLCVSVLVLPGQLRDSSPTGAAWVTGSSKHVAQGLLAGMLAGCCYAAVAMALGPRHGHTPMGPVAKMAMTPGLPRTLWMFAVLAIGTALEQVFGRLPAPRRPS